ncbi:hypothetical protein SAMN02745126_03121 [Enhydrobacter aerosaccus]|uniref:Uncharacterized protein n=1 Tax=Enhydrobacter aerosaccus TaxID=225324 RepID=A0A1T4QCW9_9HYPH|nr:hypothetical protein [Enhydrobacter aerosaccus]SKA01078.1 hypothetical protein SAMN02745126_03121 [Enhydrobacter aerosaccus]
MAMVCLVLALLITLISPAAQAQIPPEWQAAAHAVIGDLERGTPQADKPWGRELHDGWRLARAWRKHNNGNIEIILAEYLTFTLLCREAGCEEETIEGKPYRDVAAEVKALRAEQGNSYALVGNAHAWLARLSDPTGAAAKDAALWSKDPDVVAADFATSNLYGLAWLLGRARATAAGQAETFTRLGLFVHGTGWVGPRCLDISRVATTIDAPPEVENCK